jgi:hypothetical protein
MKTEWISRGSRSREEKRKIEVVAPSARQRLTASAAQPLPRKSAVDQFHNTKNLT